MHYVNIFCMQSSKVIYLHPKLFLKLLEFEDIQTTLENEKQYNSYLSNIFQHNVKKKCLNSSARVFSKP